MNGYDFKYPEHSKALYHALTEDAFYITMERSVRDGSPMEAMFRYMDYSMREAEHFGELFIPEGDGFGASVWSRPLGRETEAEKKVLKRSFLSGYMGEESLETYDSIVQFMSDKTGSVVDDSCWYLSIVGVLPKLQGQGLGVGLVESVLDKTDALGVPTYLETFTRRNTSFYERLGYRIADSFHEPTTDADYWVMVRDAR